MNVKHDLFKLASEMAMCKSMPSPINDDWNCPKGMQITSWRKVCDFAFKAEDQCKDWAVRLGNIACSMD